MIEKRHRKVAFIVKTKEGDIKYYAKDHKQAEGLLVPAAQQSEKTRKQEHKVEYYTDDSKAKGQLLPDEKRSEEIRIKEHEEARKKHPLVPSDEEVKKNENGKGLLLPAEGEL